MSSDQAIDPNDESWRDPVIEYYKQFVDREEIRANLRLTPEQRLEKLEAKLEAASKEGSVALRCPACGHDLSDVIPK